MIYPQFERTYPNFRGSNDKRIGFDDARTLVGDAIDLGLYGSISPEEKNTGEFIHYRDNESLWSDILARRVNHGDTIHLKDFQLIEWLPTAPGRYFTSDAARSRNDARRWWDMTRGEYLPLGKAEMVLGGVGSVRLAPRHIRGGEICFFGATSNGISHCGIPLITPIDVGKKILKYITKVGACTASITGSIWPLPLGASPITFDRGIPKYFFFVESFDNISEPKTSPLVSVAIAFNSTYSSDRNETKTFGKFNLSSNKHWSFASFNPTYGFQALNSAVDWLKKYIDYYGEASLTNKSSIVGDFDETQEHFNNSLEFPLANIISGKYNAEIIQFYAETFDFSVNKEVILGDKFENVSNSTIVNRSTVQSALNSQTVHGHPELIHVLKEIIHLVERSQNFAAGALLNGLAEEIKKPSPQKSIIDQCWDGLVKVIPEVAKVAGAAAAIAGLLV